MNQRNVFFAIATLVFVTYFIFFVHLPRDVALQPTPACPIPTWLTHTESTTYEINEYLSSWRLSHALIVAGGGLRAYSSSHRLNTLIGYAMATCSDKKKSPTSGGVLTVLGENALTQACKEYCETSNDEYHICVPLISVSPHPSSDVDESNGDCVVKVLSEGQCGCGSRAVVAVPTGPATSTSDGSTPSQEFLDYIQELFKHLW